MTLRAFDVFDEVCAYSRAEDTARLVMLVYARRAGNDERIAYPSVQWLEAATRKSRRQVQRARADLLDLQELELVDAGGGRGRPAAYRIADLVALYGVPIEARKRRPATPAARPLMAITRNGDTGDALSGGNGAIKGVTKGATHARAGREDQGLKETSPTPPASGRGSPANRFSRSNGKNPRAAGTNPRALGTNPRAAARAAEFDAIASALQPPDTAAAMAWEGVRAEIRDAVSETNWIHWLSGLNVVAVDRDQLVIAAPATAHAWIANRFARLVDAASAHVDVGVRLATDQEAAALAARIAS